MPVAFEPSSAGAEAEGLLDVPLLEPQAARKDGPRTSAAAAAAPPPMNRLRDVGFAAIAWIFEDGMATLPFVDVREKAGLGAVRRLRVVEHLFEVFGGRDVGGRQYQRRIGGPADMHFVTRAQNRQILLGTDERQDRRVVG